MVSLFPFWRGNTLRVNLVQKFKIVSWSWNLVRRLSEIFRIQLGCSFFPFLTWKSGTIQLSFWYYLILLKAVCSLRLEASGVSCFCWNRNEVAQITPKLLFYDVCNWTRIHVFLKATLSWDTSGCNWQKITLQFQRIY